MQSIVNTLDANKVIFVNKKATELISGLRERDTGLEPATFTLEG